MEAAEYRVWVRAPDHVQPVDGVDYDQVAIERLKPSPKSAVREVLGERRPAGWVLAKVGEGRVRPGVCCTRRTAKGLRRVLRCWMWSTR